MRDGRSGIIAALVAAAVSLLIGAGTVAVSWWTQNQQHERAISDLKLKILSRVATDERSVANAALVHVLRPLDTEERYSSFVESYLELASQLALIRE